MAKKITNEEKYNDIFPRFNAIRETFKSLTAKKPNDPINLFKLNQLNKIIQESNDLLEGLIPDKSFTGFDQDSMPTNSDVVLILDLYAAAFLKFYNKNTIHHSSFNMDMDWDYDEWKN